MAMIVRAPGKAKTEDKKSLHDCRLFDLLGWLMGLEPTTTRITIWDSTN